MIYDVVIVGGGIVGLATGLKLLEKNPGLKIAVVEKEKQPAQHQTGHNSGVIHSGIYYKPGSLKAHNCKEGYNMLLHFSKEHGIKHDLCGKIIVATKQDELPLLENIYKRGVENGLQGLKKISATEIKDLEPHCSGIAGVLVPQAGIIDYKQVALKYAELIKAKGGELFFDTKLIQVIPNGTSTELVTTRHNIRTKLFVNCAGLYSDKVANLTQKVDLKIIPFRGEYYELKPEKQYLVKNLIYPVPNPNFPFLGVHFTRMIHGGVEAGPNAVLAFAREGYKKSDVNFAELAESLTFSGFRKVAMKYWREGWEEMYRSFSKRAFVKALQQLVPAINDDDLIRGGAGVRAQACDEKGNLIDDFLILEDDRVINVCNAPSPAATSSLAIGNTIAEMALKRVN